MALVKLAMKSDLEPFFPWDWTSEIYQLTISRWWQLKYFLISPLFGEDEPILTSIFFKGVGSTTNQKSYKVGLGSLANPANPSTNLSGVPTRKKPQMKKPRIRMAENCGLRSFFLAGGNDEVKTPSREFIPAPSKGCQMVRYNGCQFTIP